jgi:hypothetical protein
MNQTVNIVIFEGGEQNILHVSMEAVPSYLKEKFAPFVGKIVTFDGDTIQEYEVNEPCN